MRSYLMMLQAILANGVRKPTRAKVKDQNIDAVSMFGYMLKHKLSNGFPLLTTKKTSFNNIKHELIWFMRGETNIQYLKDNNVNIWNEWANADGELGPVYGKQWRDFGGVDQLTKVIEDIKKTITDPTASCGRRLLVSAWNPPELPAMALSPCHLLYQFNVTQGMLNCCMYQRSCDAFLGVPYNIASYALLTHIIAKWCRLEPGEMTYIFADLHIYVNHLEQVYEQLKREPKYLPQLVINDGFTFDRIKNPDIARLLSVTNYDYHPPIKGEIAV